MRGDSPGGYQIRVPQDDIILWISAAKPIFLRIHFDYSVSVPGVHVKGTLYKSRDKVNPRRQGPPPSSIDF